MAMWSRLTLLVAEDLECRLVAARELDVWEIWRDEKNASFVMATSHWHMAGLLETRGSRNNVAFSLHYTFEHIHFDSTQWGWNSGTTCLLCC